MTTLEKLREVPTLAQTEGEFATLGELNQAYDDYLDLLDSTTVYCSLCDGIGHGQPGFGPCPLEERGSLEPDEAELKWGAF